MRESTLSVYGHLHAKSVSAGLILTWLVLGSTSCHWTCLCLIRLTANIINNCGRKGVKEKMKERGGKGADRELYNKLL